MDLKADPCEDFYQYTCGNWANARKIPEGKDLYNIFFLLIDKNKEKMIEVRTFCVEYDNFPERSRGNE
jgi:predicted metalloendopeptidase